MKDLIEYIAKALVDVLADLGSERGWSKLVMNAPRKPDTGRRVFEAVAEPHLVDPVFITSYPTEISPLSRRNDDNPLVTDRFELFIGGREIANGFSELNDPEDQAERFRQQVENLDAGDLEAMHYDADYIRALEYGMPPTAGEGIDIDRLSYTTPVTTANGRTTAAQIRLDSLDIGAIHRPDVMAMVARPGALNTSLLGMNYLSTLSSFDFRGDRLILTD